MKLGPQNEPIIEERTVGKPILSDLAGMVWRFLRPTPTWTAEDLMKLSDDAYAKLIWSVDGLKIWKINHDSGHGRPTPQCPRVKSGR